MTLLGYERRLKSPASMRPGQSCPGVAEIAEAAERYETAASMRPGNHAPEWPRSRLPHRSQAR